MKIKPETIERNLKAALTIPFADASDLASFCWDNWRELTGLSLAARFDEGFFPSPIEELVEHHGFDMDDFSQEWILLT